jgi:hypothetical protein
MDMISQQGPGKGTGAHFLGQVSQASDKFFPVPIISKDRLPFDPSNHHVV